MATGSIPYLSMRWDAGFLTDDPPQPLRQIFVFIIDEWDAVIREGEPAAQKAYLNLLRRWFKNISFTPKVERLSV